MIDDGRFTLAAPAVGSSRMEAHAVTVESPDWRYRFEVVADVVGTGGNHEWLVWFSDEAKAGNYRGYETLVVRNPAPGGPLAARAYP